MTRLFLKATMNKFIEDYYKTGGLVKSKDKDKLLKNEEVHQLLKKPKKDTGKEIPHMQNIEPMAVCQCDLLYLPDDKGFKFALVMVDVGSGLTDAEPLKERDAESVLTAYKKITARNPLKNAPKYMLQCDSGVEFKGVFSTYVKSKGVTIRVGEVGRSRQQAIAESRNKTIAEALFHRQVSQELLTEQPSKEWVNHLKTVIKVINKFQNEKDKTKNKKTHKPYIPKKTELLAIGDSVRIQLEEPLDTAGRKLHGGFRATDIRWSRKISKVSNIIIDDGEPILYQVDDKPTSYTYNQLQFVNEAKLNEPPASVIEGTPETYVVKAIKDKRTHQRKIQYLIQWKGYPKPEDYTWEPRTELIKKPLIKKLIEKYESEN